MLVKEIMTVDVKTISPGSTIQQAGKIMSQAGIGSLIVVEKEMLAGMLTEGDIIRKVVAKNMLPSKTNVDDVMTTEVVAVGPDTSIEDAANAMTERRVKRLPVVTENQLVGIISAMDIVAAQPKMIERIARLVLMPSKKKLTAG